MSRMYAGNACIVTIHDENKTNRMRTSSERFFLFVVIVVIIVVVGVVADVRTSKRTHT